MKKTLFTVALCTVFLAAAANAQQNGWMSRYWDGCKPSCSWSGKPDPNRVGQCKECNKSNQRLTPTNDMNKSSCDGGNSYTCWDMIPFAVDANMAYGFAATPSDQCGQCFELTFNGTGHHGQSNNLNGKKMIVMGSNMGGDVQGGQFDLLVPGGGVGQFDSFSGQLNKNASELGSRYGGLLDACNGSASCLKTSCASVFSGQPLLKQGCDFYADWMGGANNPNLTYRTITCPDVLVEIFKGTKTGPGDGGPIVIPPTTYTLTMSVNPNNSGTTNPASQQQNIQSGTPVNITANANNGYTFNNWSVVSGTATFGNPNSANTTVSLSTNATIRANFSQQQTTTYTLTVNRSPSNGGNTSPAQSQSNITAGQAISISATANNGYTFTNWTVTSANGTATISNPNSTTTTVTLSNNATIQANFQQQQSGGNYTLTVNRNPNNGGTTTPAQSQSNISAGQAVSITATPNNGYSFVNWTLTNGSATFVNANSATTTVTLSNNATIQANFNQGTGGGEGNTYMLTTGVSPANSGTTSPASLSNISAGQAVSITATPNNGYSFINWTVTSGSATFANANSASTTVTFNALAKRAATAAQNIETTIVANFIQGTGGSVNWSGAGILKIEAENYVNKNGANMVISTNNGITNIGYIENNYSTTYKINLTGAAGTFPMDIRIATAMSSYFTVWANGQQVGTCARQSNDWDAYQTVRLEGSGIPLNQGDNTIEFRFQSAVNVDYFQLTGSGTLVRYNTVKTNNGVRSVALTASPRGFTAVLPANHGYTAYRLVDLQGREVRSGSIGNATSSLRFDNLKNSVLLLRLEGKNTSTVVKAVTY